MQMPVSFAQGYEPAHYGLLSPEQQERILSLQQDVLESVALGHDCIGVIEQICRLEERSVPNSVASVMVLDEGRQCLDVLAAPSMAAEGVRQLNGLRPGPGAGSCGNAVYRGEPVFVDDTLTDQRWQDLRQVARDFNILACWSMPIRGAGGRVIGSFALSSFEHRPPSAFDRMLLQIGAHIIGIVLERRAAQSRIAFLASHDVLTDLPNRTLARDRLEQAMARAQREKHRVAVLFIDLDNFKMVNDSLGHDVGDQLLKLIASRLRECVRESDTVARQSGDEFLVLLPGIHDMETITRVADKILDRMEAPFKADNFDLNSTLSIGVSVYPDDGRDVETLVRRADTAMYHAKEAGRNTYRYFTGQMNVDSTEHLRLRTGMRRALDRDEFVLHYQAQFDILTGRITGAEALLRWQHPELGMVLPGKFIALAEASGLIVPIGAWVLEAACLQAATWQRKGLLPLLVAVNLSSVQFRRGNIESVVEKALRAASLDPALLELEITESILLQDTDAVLGALQRLKAIGVKIAIDDFGTGYSSLAYLRRLSVDRLKIDRTFIQDMASNPENASIARAIVQMARGLNLRTVAEGVEEAGVIQMLRDCACDDAQGYHFALPGTAEEFAALIEDRR